MSTISKSVLTKKCDIRGTLVPIKEEKAASPPPSSRVSTPLPPPPSSRVSTPLPPPPSSRVSTPLPPPPSSRVSTPLPPPSPSPSPKKKVSSLESISVSHTPSPPKKKIIRKKSQQTCPCLIVSKGIVCGKPIKENGRCGIHKNKCVSPEKDDNEPIAKPINEGAKCSCIITTRKGEKKECGKKVKANGVCGVHAKKCVREEKEPEIPEPAVEEKPITGAFEVQEKEEGKCSCIVKSRKKGEADKVCGRTIKNNGRCGFHQKTCISAPAPDKQEKPKAPSPPKYEPPPIPDEREYDPEPEPEPENLETEWKFKSVKDLGKIYNRLLEIPEEDIDIGEIKELKNTVLLYLRQ